MQHVNFRWLFLLLLPFMLNAQQLTSADKIPVLDQLLGEWDAFQIKKNSTGQWSGDTTYAQWHWYTILDGDAIQDDWIGFSKNQESKQQPYIAGRNIRIYNSDEKQWYMTWIGRGSKKLAHFKAVNENNMVIMSGKNISGRHVHNTFFNITANSFDWKQEWTFDEGKNWIEVSRIHCKRRI
jgi:hypothetical protein